MNASGADSSKTRSWTAPRVGIAPSSGISQSSSNLSHFEPHPEDSDGVDPPMIPPIVYQRFFIALMLLDAPLAAVTFP